MHAFSLRVSGPAERSLARLPERFAAAITEFITGPLLENPRRVGKSLGLDLKGFHGARCGAYRIVYWIDDTQHVVIVDRIDHRADVYRPR
jgi:mRNA interferase RelE/StbE